MTAIRGMCMLCLIFFLYSITASAQSIDWLSLEDARNKASENGKKVMLYFEADWCQYCQKMNKEVFPKSPVIDSLHTYFYPVRIDIDSEEEVRFNGRNITEKSLAQKFRALRTPTTIFMDAEGSVIGTQPGYLPVHIFTKLLSYVGSEAYGHTAFDEYLAE